MNRMKNIDIINHSGIAKKSTDFNLNDSVITLLKTHGKSADQENYQLLCNWCNRNRMLIEQAPQIIKTMSKIQLDEILREEFKLAQTENSARLYNVIEEVTDKINNQLELIQSSIVAAHNKTSDYSIAMENSLRQLNESKDNNSDHVQYTLKNAETVLLQAKDCMYQMQTALNSSSNDMTNLRTELDKAIEQSNMDLLTGIYNRRAIEEYIKAQVSVANTNGTNLSVVLCDVDHFKNFNDRWGHQIGDEVLRLVAQTLDSCVNAFGTVARYGGEEFIIILPGKTIDSAYSIAEEIRNFLNSKRVKTYKNNKTIGNITLSMGVSAYVCGDPSEKMIYDADMALHEAKSGGRNCVRIKRPNDYIVPMEPSFNGSDLYEL